MGDLLIYLGILANWNTTFKQGDKLIVEREDLVSNKRKEIAERLKDAKDNAGDLSENTEYEYAKNEQAFIEGRIEQINEILNNHVIIEEGNNFLFKTVLFSSVSSFS